MRVGEGARACGLDPKKWRARAASAAQERARRRRTSGSFFSRAPSSHTLTHTHTHTEPRITRSHFRPRDLFSPRALESLRARDRRKSVSQTHTPSRVPCPPIRSGNADRDMSSAAMRGGAGCSLPSCSSAPTSTARGRTTWARRGSTPRAASLATTTTCPRSSSSSSPARPPARADWPLLHRRRRDADPLPPCRAGFLGSLFGG